ncbi:porin [Dyadobacter sp. 3J3]|uniref:porin n=1 Tax=Dyadobacter sp. 3J3 TaxID=2606600 RepID=UPI00135CCEB8|nr:porin [Dyadobacter sp. 3J3]
MEKAFFTVTIMICLSSSATYSQNGSNEFKDGMKIKLDSSGKKYINFITYATFWARISNANPGTAINGVKKTRWTDFSIRQFRLITYSQLNKHYLILADIGIDNQSFSTGGSAGGGNTGNGSSTFAGTLGKKPALYIHDLWNEYMVLPDVDETTGKPRKLSLYVGTGLHYWIGISRMTTSSSSTYLALDVPLFNWPLTDYSDQFARQLGIYFKGNAGPVAYRWAINKPFTVLSPNTVFNKSTADSSYAVDNNTKGNLSTTGYVAWQLFEKESHLLPYTTGTYVGTKKVFNIGMGYYFTKNGTATSSSTAPNASLIRHNILLWSTDCFVDIPFGGVKNWAFTGYSVFYKYDFGPKYLRYESNINANVGPAPGYTGPISQAGFGNLAPVTGSGNTLFTQIGMLLPKQHFTQIRFQPFGELALQKFERYENSRFHYWSIGGNIYLDGHHSRLTFKYQTRPIVENNSQQSSKGTFILATQVNL